MSEKFLVWNVPPVFIQFGPFQIRFYALFFVLGIVLARWVGVKLFKREGLDPLTLNSLVVYTLVGTLVGARLGHTLIYQPEIYLRDPLRILKIWEGGLASHGGTLGIVVSSLVWKRKYWDRSILALSDLLCIGLSLIAAMIRIGNLFNSEIIGKVTHVPWAIIFSSVDLLPRHPTMIYESIAYFLTFCFLLLLYQRGAARKAGLISGVFFVLVFGSRFCIEFLKEAQVPSEVGMQFNYGQWLSLPFILWGIFLILRGGRMRFTLTEKENSFP